MQRNNCVLVGSCMPKIQQACSRFAKQVRGSYLWERAGNNKELARSNAVHGLIHLDVGANHHGNKFHVELLSRACIFGFAY